MEKFKLQLAAFFALISFISYSQVFCGNSNSVAVYNNPISPCTTNTCLIPQYIPGPNDSIIYVRLNFWVFQPSAGAGTYANFSSAWCDSIVQWMNDKGDSLNAPNLVVPGVQYVKRPKIKFRKNIFQTVVDPTAYYSNALGFNSNQLSYSTYSTGINILFVASTNTALSGYGEASGIPSNLFKYVFDDNFTNFSLSNMSKNTFYHEIGHCLGLPHTILGMNNPIAGDNCFYNDYQIESVSNWTIQPANCNVFNPSFSNNVMGYNGCNNYYSPYQIATMRYNLLNNGIIYNTIVNSNIFQGYNCSLADTNFNIIISNNTNWITSQCIKGDVRIKSGATLTISVNQEMPVNGKIIVEPGGKLITMPFITLTCKCSPAKWSGIEVWGDKNSSQYSNNQGSYFNLASNIFFANVGVSVGKSLNNGLFDPNFGGGIFIDSIGSYDNNNIDVEFGPYVWLNKSYNNQNITSFAPVKNRSYLKQTIFNNSAPKLTAIKLNDVYGIGMSQINVNHINNSYNASYGILSINSSFILKNNSIIKYGQNGIYCYGLNYNDKTIIDNVVFYIRDENGIYANNVNNIQITNCSFNLVNNHAIPNNYPIVTGLYLNNSTGYLVENNTFFNSNNDPRVVGLYVRNSGPYSNSLYNNSFLNLSQGLWAIGQNYDPNSGIGLKINCNDFSNCNYNIGVQKSQKLSNFLPNNTGIASTQGLPNNGPSLTVRNTYDAPFCFNGAENKFYINTFNNFFINHGTFLQASFHPTPSINARCSNSIEVINIPGASAPPSRSSYCPLNNLPLLAKSSLYNEIATLTNSLSILGALAQNTIDGGNTQVLLNYINSNSSVGNLKNLMEQYSPYVSDEALIAYFNKQNIPAGHIKDIHEKNKPVSPLVWQAILNRNLPNGVMKDLIEQQAVNSLSPKNQLVATKQLYTTNLNLMYNELITRFANDTTPGSADSLINKLNQNVINNSDVLLSQVLIKANRFEQANSILNTLTSKGSIYEDFAIIQKDIIALAKNPNYINVLRLNNSKKEDYLKMAQTGNYLSEGIASSMLFRIWKYKLQEEKLEPEIINSNARFNTNVPDETEETAIYVADNIKVYPNPANDKINIEIKDNEEYIIVISDVNGKQVAIQKINSHLSQFELKELNNGVYLVSIKNKGKSIANKKVIVLH